MAIQPGTRLGPYEITAQIGVGGMGEVYRATDTKLKRDVAVKVLPESVATDPERLARFQCEAEVLASLNHPNIAAIYGLEDSADTKALVMELVEGPTLADRIVQGAVSVDEALCIAKQIAEALEAAHGQGIIHRDLKPDNVKVRVDGTAKVLDFGLAKAIEPTTTSPSVSQLPTVVSPAVTQAGMILGTASYMSPEQAEGKRIDGRSDIFSLGVVLYEMVSGRRAFDGDSTVRVLSSVLRDEPRPLEATPELTRIVTRCLRKVPAERFQTVTEVKRALELVPSNKEDTQPSIAVLPFADMSPGRDHEWFSDGVAEEIINLLAHIPGLKVIARTSAFAFKDQQQDIRRIVEVLGVAHVLEGSVRKAGNRVRVTAQMIAAADGSHLWSERYDRDMEDVFAVQDEIAAAITTVLQVKLSGTRTDVSPRHAPSVPAYEAYLKARHHWGKVTPEAMERSKEWYERTIALDPEFALGHIGLADYFLLLTAGVGLMPAHEAMPQLRTLAQRALDVDPSLPEAHGMLGVVARLYDHDWQEAERRFRLAMTQDPVPPHVRQWYGFFYLLPLGRPQEAVAELELALRADPLNNIIRICFAFSLGRAGRHEDESAELYRVLELDEGFWYAYCLLAKNRAVRGMLPEGLAFAERAYAMAPWNSQPVGALAALLVLTGSDLPGDFRTN